MPCYQLLTEHRFLSNTSWRDPRRTTAIRTGGTLVRNPGDDLDAIPAVRERNIGQVNAEFGQGTGFGSAAASVSSVSISSLSAGSSRIRAASPSGIYSMDRSLRSIARLRTPVSSIVRLALLSWRLTFSKTPRKYRTV